MGKRKDKDTHMGKGIQGILPTTMAHQQLPSRASHRRASHRRASLRRASLHASHRPARRD